MAHGTGPRGVTLGGEDRSTSRPDGASSRVGDRRVGGIGEGWDEGFGEWVDGGSLFSSTGGGFAEMNRGGMRGIWKGGYAWWEVVVCKLGGKEMTGAGGW